MKIHELTYKIIQNNIITSKEKLEKCKLIANILMITAAILLSISVYLAQHVLPYILFMCSHILWSICAIYMSESKLLQLNGFMLFLDFYAIYIRAVG